MSFAAKDENAGSNNKQHLNLSIFAYEVIHYDMSTFGGKSLSGIINTIFENYYPIADASIELALNRLQGELDACMEGILGEEETKKRVLEKLRLQKKESLLQKAKAYEKGKSFKFSLNKSNFEYLTESNAECMENKHYLRRGEYIKCVLEEYARLPYLERERVYFNPFMTVIQEAIDEEVQLRVRTDKDIVYSVYPYKILSDSLSTANYLVGYCTKYDSPEEEKRPCSFRISSLKSIRMEKSKRAFLKKAVREELAAMIALRGVQFMVGNETEIHVRLTEAGEYKYRRQIHLRPPLISEQGDRYIFRCTTAQAEFYFFKFGKDAEILQPLELRERFRSMYEAAADNYTHERREILS